MLNRTRLIIGSFVTSLMALAFHVNNKRDGAVSFIAVSAVLICLAAATEPRGRN